MSAVYGKPGTNVNDFYQGSVGVVRPNFSVDLVAGHGSDIVSTFALSGAANLNSKYLGAKVFDTDMYGIFGKYVFDLGQNGLQDPAGHFDRGRIHTCRIFHTCRCQTPWHPGIWN